jgi:hypothetical protein
VDLFRVSQLVGGAETFTAEQKTSLKATSSKVVKHEKTWSYNQHSFIPFTFDTFSFLAPDTIDLLQGW